MASAAHAQTLLLEIWIDGRDTHVIAHVVRHGNSLEIANADLADAGLAVARAGTRLIDAKSDIRGEEDEAGQRLLLTVDPARLSRTVVDLRPSIMDEVTPAARGAMLRYDVSATMNDVSHPHRTSSAGLSLALTLFQDETRFTLTGFATTGLSQRSARLDTALEFDTPSAPRRLVFGDAITGVPQWARAVRFGGLELATDFSQQPDRVTFPLPQFSGLAAVPSTVDVFVGASRVSSTPVDAGPFALNDLPVLTGGGGATVVVRDMLGRETSRTISLYTDPSLLADGLTSYALDAGFLRRGYGVVSADYATPFASATWRRGFKGFTGELHGEAAQGYAQAGGGIGFSVGDFGLWSAGAAVSRRDGQRGALASLDFSARADSISFFGDIAATAGRFSDLASLAGDVFPSLRYQASASAALGRAGSLSFGWIGERTQGSASSRLLTGSYALSFGEGLYLSLTGLRDLVGGHWAFQFFFNMPLGDGLASASTSAGAQPPDYQAQYAEPADPDGGFGYRVLANAGSSRRLEADANWIADQGEIDGGVSIADGAAALRMGASGGLVLLDDKLFATKAPEGAVALVRAGAPDVRIYRENRPVAVSDMQGDALLTGLSPYTTNRIGIDPRDYPIDADVAISQRRVVPPRNTGVIVDMVPERRNAFIAVVMFANGRYPRVGARVDVVGTTVPLIVGRDGEIFFGGLTQPVDAVVERDEGPCRVTIVPPPPTPQRVPRAGPFICRETADAH
ncbi:MAG TPA: fimbria/pilus outer membrane usher protein [Rhizomicrobium sp.]|nr:fimbria/pilus outer membrane usher protein [Rhizomicrobium sp.]